MHTQPSHCATMNPSPQVCCWLAPTRVVEGQQAEEVELGAQPVHVARQHLLAVAARHLREGGAGGGAGGGGTAARAPHLTQHRLASLHNRSKRIRSHSNRSPPWTRTS